MWFVYALLSAGFAALVAILVKIGLAEVNATLAIAIRTVVVLVMAWGMVFLTGRQHDIMSITQRAWVFLVLSGFATGFSWLFYFRALQVGDVSRVVPVDRFSVVISMVLAFVILGEAFTLRTILGGILITIGTLVLVL
jgi:transporter family protein